RFPGRRRALVARETPRGHYEREELEPSWCRQSARRRWTVEWRDEVPLWPLHPFRQPAPDELASASPAPAPVPTRPPRAWRAREASRDERLPSPELPAVVDCLVQPALAPRY